MKKTKKLTLITEFFVLKRISLKCEKGNEIDAVWTTDKNNEKSEGDIQKGKRLSLLKCYKLTGKKPYNPEFLYEVQDDYNDTYIFNVKDMQLFLKNKAIGATKAVEISNDKL